MGPILFVVIYTARGQDASKVKWSKIMKRRIEAEWFVVGRC